jgi:hypothetical protein
MELGFKRDFERETKVVHVNCVGVTTAPPGSHGIV